MATAHRELDLRRFVASVSPDLLRRYFEGLGNDDLPPPWASLNGAELDRFLASSDNSGIRAIIRSDLRKLNDLCGRGMSLLVETYEKFGLPFDPNATSEEQAIRLFLDHEEAWGFAWSRYLLFALGGRVYTYFMPAGNIQPSTEALEAFRTELKSGFSKQSKGDQCEIQQYADRGQQVFYIERGWYMRAYSHWQGESIAVQSYRPALDDVIAYDPTSSDLIVKAPHERDREQYVRSFATCIVGKPELAEQALNFQTYDLSPVRDGKFNYAGNNQISSVDLVGIKLQLPGARHAKIEVRSPDVRKTMETIPGLTLKSGKLVSARFSFRFYAQKGPTPRVTFEISPPSRTDLPDTMLSGIINSYLKEQRVKLR